MPEPTLTTPLLEYKPEVKPEELVLPVVHVPTFVYNKDTQMFWLGIPVATTDVVTASFILDSCKMQYLTCFNHVAQALREKESKIVPSSMFNRMRENFLNRKYK